MQNLVITVSEKGDNKTTISNEQQQTEISQVIVAWLQSRTNK